jgi:TonB family protein
MRRTTPERGRVASAWALSLAAHIALLAAGAALVARLAARDAAPALAPAAPAPVEATLDIELPTLLDGTLADSATPKGAPPPAPVSRGGGEHAPRLDARTQGHGGTDTALDPALNLADRDDRIFLSPEVQSRLDRSQIQRLRSDSHRASREDLRASRSPMELTFLAMGRTDSPRPERRAPGERDPSRGATLAGTPVRAGATLGAASLADGVFASRPVDPGGPTLGAPEPSPGLGVRDGAPGTDPRASARVALARPLVEAGFPSVPADARGKPSDTVDSEQEVATAMLSILHASTVGGAPGPGTGGAQGPGPAGAGGLTGPGARSTALGTVRGPAVDSALEDPRRSLYLRGVMSKVNRLWSFPRWASAEGRQGVSSVSFTILADGTLASVVVTRPSGIPEFDASCKRAVERAAPFGPLPAAFPRSYRVSMSFDAQNPAVLPKRPRPEKSDM